jgi:hypothetical protein
MKKSSGEAKRFVGLDVHAATIAVAVAEANGEVRSLGTIPNRPASVKRLVKKLNENGTWKACYEAGPTGYAFTGNRPKWALPARSLRRHSSR